MSCSVLFILYKYQFLITFFIRKKRKINFWSEIFSTECQFSGRKIITHKSLKIIAFCTPQALFVHGVMQKSRRRSEIPEWPCGIVIIFLAGLMTYLKTIPSSFLLQVLLIPDINFPLYVRNNVYFDKKKRDVLVTVSARTQQYVQSVHYSVEVQFLQNSAFTEFRIERNSAAHSKVRLSTGDCAVLTELAPR